MVGSVAVELVLSYQGQQLREQLRAPLPGESTVFKLGRTHAFGGHYPFQREGVVSGSHLRLQLTDDLKLHITDTSSNGTFMNGRQLRKGRTERVEDGAKITLVAPTARVAAMRVVFQRSCELSDNETNLIRRYVSLLSAVPTPNVRRERVQIDKDLLALTQYSLGDYDPKKHDDSNDSLNSAGSVGAADGHNATLHFKAPIHIVMANKHNKVRPGMKQKELPEQPPAPKPPQGVEVNPDVQKFCCQQLNFALVRAFHKVHGDPSSSAEADPRLAQLREAAARLDGIEESIVTSGHQPTGLDDLSSTQAVSTPTRRVGPRFLMDVYALSKSIRELDDSLLRDEAFENLLAVVADGDGQ